MAAHPEDTDARPVFIILSVFQSKQKGTVPQNFLPWGGTFLVLLCILFNLSYTSKIISP